jgi:hypothetical protein
MAFNQVTATSLTPSRPVPQIPIRQTSISSSSTAYSSSSSVTLTPPSISTPSYATSYSGIGGTPNIGGFPKRSSDGAGTSGVVRQGPAGFKEDAFASWIWREKWLVLKEHSLSVHKNEVSSRSTLSGVHLLASASFEAIAGVSSVSVLQLPILRHIEASVVHLHYTPNLVYQSNFCLG